MLGTQIEIKPDSDFHFYGLFERRARITPDRTALRFGTAAVSYGELERRVENIAANLSAQGVRQDSTVALHLERSVGWVAGMLAILRCNAAVLPLPPSYPPGRLREVLEFASVDAIISDVDISVDLPEPDSALLIDELTADVDGVASFVSAGTDRAAFILCSSGTTGKPKLIVRSHRSFFHRLSWTWGELPYRDDSVCCQKAHMTTTHSIYELFEPLLCGVAVEIISDETARNLEEFWATISEKKVSRLLIVPSALRASFALPDFPPQTIDVLTIMGEYVDNELAQRVLEAFPINTKVYSIYGSTEASSTLLCDVRESFTRDDKLTLGIPISHDVQPVVLDADLKPVESGGTGRLYMAGTALFSSYLGDEEATRAAFVQSPEHQAPLFDTRDDVKLLPDGRMIYAGRQDHTVKIRGFRVNTDEVEGALRSHSAVSDAAVVVTDEESGAASLVGFVRPASIDKPALIDELRRILPDYMIPSSLTAMDTFPATSSGKIDRKKLLQDRKKNEPVAVTDQSVSDTERKVIDVWQTVLGHADFDTEMSFFEVGGTSLTAFALVLGLREAFGLSNDRLTGQLIYSFPSVSGLAQRLDEILDNKGEPADVEIPILVPLRTGVDTSKPPVFLIAAGGGTLGAYEKLVEKLDSSRDILGIRDPFLWGGRHPTEGFQHWVQRYLEAIQSRQAEGPYTIVAYSSGGCFGIEIARQLRAAGHEVSQLVLIDTLALDRRKKWCYGYLALKAPGWPGIASSMVRLAGWLRIPLVKLNRERQKDAEASDPTWTDAQFADLADNVTRDKNYLLMLAALLELSSEKPFALTEADFDDVEPSRYLSVFLSRAEQASPGTERETLEKLVVQFQLQVRTQHAYRLPYLDCPVLVVEPKTSYAGILAVQIRPYAANMQSFILNLGPEFGSDGRLSGYLGHLEGHYRSMRDAKFVAELAALLQLKIDDD